MTYFILQALLVLSTLIELTYDLGVFTRQHILPVVVYLTVGAYYYYQKSFDYLTSQEFVLAPTY